MIALFLGQPGIIEAHSLYHIYHTPAAVWPFAIPQLNQPEPLMPYSWVTAAMNKTGKKVFFSPELHRADP